MSEERKQVLKMLAEGKISAEEAERLLDKLSTSDEKKEHGWRGRHRRRKHLNLGAAVPGDGAGEEEGAENGRKPLKYLRVEVHSSDGDQVNVRVPLKLIQTGVKLTTLLPTDTNAKLAEKGIDLAELGKLEGDELVEALRDLKVDVDSTDGDRAQVYCE